MPRNTPTTSSGSMPPPVTLPEVSPPTGVGYYWQYRCTFYDRDTGEELGSSYQRVITDSPTNYQRASRIARQAAISQAESEGSPPIVIGPNVKLRCRRVGSVLAV